FKVCGISTAVKRQHSKPACAAPQYPHPDAAWNDVDFNSDAKVRNGSFPNYYKLKISLEANGNSMQHYIQRGQEALGARLQGSETSAFRARSHRTSYGR